MTTTVSAASSAIQQHAPLEDNEMYHNLQVIPENELQAEENEEDDNICCICLNPLKDNGALLGHIPMSHQQIKHIFHKSCIETCIRISADCPHCPYCGIHIQLPTQQEAPEENNQSMMPSMGTVAAVAAGVGALALGTPASLLIPVAGLAAAGRYFYWY